MISEYNRQIMERYLGKELVIKDWKKADEILPKITCRYFVLTSTGIDTAVYNTHNKQWYISYPDIYHSVEYWTEIPGQEPFSSL